MTSAALSPLFRAISRFVRALQIRAKLARQRIFARGSEIGLIAAAAMVGVLSGCAVSGMSWISRALHSLIFGISRHEWLSASQIDNRLILLGAPILGGLMMGALFLALRNRRNRPIIDPIEANALYGGRISLTDSVIVAVQNLVSNGFGASVGLEAGYTQLSSGLASKLGSALNLRRADLRILVGCGAAGAIAAAFNAPLTGAFYAFELIIGIYSAVALAPVVVAAIVATVVARTVSGNAFLINIGDIGPITPGDFLPAMLLGACCAVLGVVIMKAVAFAELVARRSSVPAALRPALGGLLVGLMAMVTPQVLAAGHGALHLTFETDATLASLIVLFLLKATASAISIGSGFRGGLFFASLFMGALIGKIAAVPMALVLGGPLTPTVLAVVGMSSLAVALIGGPLTMTFLALELTGDFPITALVLAAVISASVVVRTTFGYSFATWRFHLRGESIRSAHDIGWIRNLTVATLMRTDVKTARASLSLQEFREAFPLGSHQRAIIVDDEDRYVGIILLAEVYARMPDGDGLSSLDPFIRCRNDVLLPQMNARQAASLFDKTRSDALAVVNSPAERRVIGQLSESHTLRRYSEELDRYRRDAVGETV